MLVNIAWRNVWRNKGRSIVVIASIALGLWGGIFSYAFMQGMSNQQIDSTIHTETGHIQVNQPKFLLNYDLQKNIKNSANIENSLRSLPGVKGVTSSIQLTAMASTTVASLGIRIVGINPETFKTVNTLNKYIVDGVFFDENIPNSVVIGQQLANKLHAVLHSRIVITLQSYSGEITYFAFKVIGIYKSQNPEFNEQMAFVQEKDLQKAIGFPNKNASVINILLTNNEITDDLKKQIQLKFPDLQVQTWQELSPMMQVMSGTINQMSIIFVFIILLALAFGIINTMLMAVMDRTRELGMLLCIGMNQKKVFGMIVLETLFLSLSGAIVGVIVSIISIYYFGIHGISLSIISEGINAIGFSSHVYPVLDIGFYPKFSLMVIVIALISSLFPARRAIKLKPSEAVREE